MSTKCTSAAEAQSPPSPLAGIDERVLLDIIDGQRMKLYNVLGSLRCLSTALHDDQNHEAGGALELAADELERILQALDHAPLLRAARRGTQAVEECMAASGRAIIETAAQESRQ